MPILKSAKHEKFAQGLAQGLTADQAYQEAGYKADRGNAARLTTNDSIRARVDELAGKAAQKMLVTIESIAAELEAARVHAMSDPKGAAAAVSAAMGKAKLFGLLIERSENLNTNYNISDKPLTDEEWEKEHAGR